MNSCEMNTVLKTYCEGRGDAEVLYLTVKVIPKAQRTEAVEILEGAEGEQVLKVKVAAVPEKGKANEELCRYLAQELGISKSQVAVSQGSTSQRKVVKILR